MPTIECWETATFDDTSCQWVVTGDQPTEPDTECWETAIFDEDVTSNTYCQWVITGEQTQVTCPEDSSVCIDVNKFTLTGAIPIGGTYSGPGITLEVFDPLAAGVGTHTITYTFIDNNQCEEACTFEITVNALPEVDIEEIDPLCIDADSVQLVGTPEGGTWSGDGVDENGLFNPSEAGSGNHTITYSYTDNGGGNQDCDALVLSGIFDGDLSGGTPKGVELYVLHDVADLSVYGLGSANNGGGSDGEEFTFPNDAVTAGTYIYVSTNTDSFMSWFGFNPTYTSGAMSINGDDAIELFKNIQIVGLIEMQVQDLMDLLASI